MDSASLWTRRKERALQSIEDAIALAIADAEALEADRHMNGKRQSVVALRNRLTEAKNDAREIREDLGAKGAEISESTDEEKLAEVREAKEEA